MAALRTALRSLQILCLDSRPLCTRAQPVKITKPKSHKTEVKGFVDSKRVRAVGGKGGDGAISFLQLWANETAGPDGGDGGNGGHVIIQASTNVRDLHKVESVLQGKDGEKGYSKDCHGASSPHNIIQVPVGTLVRDAEGRPIGDLEKEGAMFVLARGGAGGHGNHFFATPTEQSPRVAQVGATGEDIVYHLELRSIAHFGLVGFPNAGKSSLLQAVSRARPKIAPYPFTTLQPYLGIVPYTDFTYISVADLPGIIEDSHKNRGLGLDFLRHIERCCVLILVVDSSLAVAPLQVEALRRELTLFSPSLAAKPQIILANKMDIPGSQEIMDELKSSFPEDEIVPISAKYGDNLSTLLMVLKRLYDKYILPNDKDK